MTVSDAGARQRTSFDPSFLEDRVRRDARRTSAAVTVLWAGTLAASIYVLNWLINVQSPKSPQPRGSNAGPVILVPPGESGRRGQAVDLGDHPDAPDEFPGDAMLLDGDGLPQLADVILEAVDRATPLHADQPNKRGLKGGDVGRDKINNGPDGPAVPDHQRWVIEWGGDTEAGYRRKLDHFGIYLGAVRGGRLIGAVRGFGSRPLETTAKPPEFWFVHLDRSRTEIDRRLMAAAGVDARPTDIVAHFLPEELRARMASLEAAYSHKNASQINKTVFGIRAVGGGYELFVAEQRLK
jgi:hypothetical protein